MAYNRRGILRAPSLWDHLDQVRFAIAAMKFDMVAVLGIHQATPFAPVVGVG